MYRKNNYIILNARVRARQLCGCFFLFYNRCRINIFGAQHVSIGYHCFLRAHNHICTYTSTYNVLGIVIITAHTIRTITFKTYARVSF